MEKMEDNSDEHYKHYKKVRSEKIINIDSSFDTKYDKYDAPLQCSSKNKIMLPPLDK